MYTHILMPTDGSTLSEQAIISGMSFAKAIGAKVTGMHAIPLEHIKTADEHHCDLIFMASHGWRGDKTQLLGGETQKVLSNSQQPVLIYKKQSTMH